MKPIDDLSRPHPETSLGSRWAFVADTVMGGVSTGKIQRVTFQGRQALRLTGTVSLENNGGFVQLAADLGLEGESFDASGLSAIRMILFGNGQNYNVHFRTPDVKRPWQSYRATFNAPPRWAEVTLPLASFEPYRLNHPFDTTQLTRIGLVAIGAEMEADLAIHFIGFI